MPLDVVLALIQFVALALPAIGIYMQIAYQSREDWKERMEYSLDGTPTSTTFQSLYGHGYHLSRVSIVLFSFAAIFLFVVLLIELPPNFGGTVGHAGEIATALGLYLAVALIILAVVIFAGSVAFHQAALNDSMSIKSALRIFKDQVRGLVSSRGED